MINSPQASTVVYDFLASLQAELAALGLRYEVGALTQSFDAEFCALDPRNPQAPSTSAGRTATSSWFGPASRRGTPPAVSTPHSSRSPFPGTGIVVPDRRAWNVVEVQKDGQWYRIFETHLEVQEIPEAQPYGFIFQLAQAGELVAGQVNPRAAAAPLPTILLGDLNTQAEQPGGSPLRITYNFLAQGLPFPDYSDVVSWWPPVVGTVSPLADAWSTVNPGQSGLTWGFSDDLLTGSMSQRIDFVLASGAGPSSMTTFGATATTSTTPPLHASDHLGVAATIEVP